MRKVSTKNKNNGHLLSVKDRMISLEIVYLTLSHLKRFKKAVRMVIVLLRSGGILDTHKREFIDPVDLGNFQKQPEVLTGSVFIEEKCYPGAFLK